jgi:hypothetical protein
MLLCLSLVVFVHGFSQDQLLCLFVYLLLFLFMVSHRTNSYASFVYLLFFLFMVFLAEPTPMLLCLSLVVVCSWFFSQKQLICFFVYLLLCLFMVFLTEATPMLLCLSCILFMVSHFLALTTLTVGGNG